MRAGQSCSDIPTKRMQTWDAQSVHLGMVSKSKKHAGKGSGGHLDHPRESTSIAYSILQEVTQTQAQ